MKPQKALHLHLEEEKKKPKFIDQPYVMFEKYDGWYGYMDLEEGLIRSNAGRVIPSCVELSERVKKQVSQTEGRLIFEILLHTTKDFSTLNGILNRSVGNFIAQDAYVICHDLVTDVNQSFRDRYINLGSQLSTTVNVQRAPVIAVSSRPEIWKQYAQKLWDKGAEGLILKRKDAGYSYDKRNHDLMKIKEEVTLDLLVTGFQEGNGKYEGMIGAYICTDKSGRTHTVSGMTDEARLDKSILGKVVEIKAMKILPDGQLREPRFKAIRYDKLPTDID